MIFDEKAIEAMAKAIYEDRNGRGCTPWSRIGGGHQGPYRKDARAAIAAAEASLRERGLVRDAIGCTIYEGSHWAAETANEKKFARDFDCLIVIKPKELVAEPEATEARTTPSYCNHLLIPIRDSKGGYFCPVCGMNDPHKEKRELNKW